MGRKQKKGFFERIGLKKKTQPQYTTTVTDVLEEQPQLSDEEEDDDEEEEESCSSISSVEEEGPVPQISISSPTTINSVLQQQPPYSYDGKYIKVNFLYTSLNALFIIILDKDKTQEIQSRVFSTYVGTNDSNIFY